MEIEIVDQPIQFQLYGFSGYVEDNRFGEVGFRLMNEMWRVVKESSTANTGINHWVYLPDGRMFVGVELLPDAVVPKQLESIEFDLKRYLKHVHLGPYQNLPAKWTALKTEIAERNETIGSPSLEIYGHHCDDQSKLETSIQ